MGHDDTPAPDTIMQSTTQGMTTVGSHFGPKETMDRLEAEIRKRGMEVFIRIDHAAGAAGAGLELPPTELIIFGNARAGTPLMQANQTVGLDLPLKALVWQDPSEKTWVTYAEPAAIAIRHELGSETEETVRRMTVLLDAVVSAAINR